MYCYVIQTRDTGTVWDVITSETREPKDVVFADWCAYRRKHLDESREPEERFEITENRTFEVGVLRSLTKMQPSSLAAKAVPA